MANNRIGCSSGKTKLIDPNNFYGQSSSNNMSVPLEDLTISVQLTTMKKGRTVLSSNIDTNTAQSSNTVKVTFIEGTEVNGEKVLTSKFTDLTTVFDKDTPSSSENLGITNIDIDFNSSYAPMVTINFIDLRGSSIFQNESQLNNHENKYSVFFQLPYPLYELTIKGYYGKPVKYCLHMTKFNSKFNSQTGNFEITASFIGYTYAMLSDMLLGILKAIPYTSKGAIKYGELKTLNLNELMIKIGQIDSNLSKIGASDPDAAKMSKIDSMIELINTMKIAINNLGMSIDYKDDLIGEEAYSYIVIKDSISDADKTKAKNNYNEFMSDGKDGYIDKYNGYNKDTLVNQYITPSDFLTTSGTKIKPYPDKSFLIPEDITNKVIDRKPEAGAKKFYIWDMTPLFTELNTRKTNLEIEKKNLQLKLGETIKNSITKSLSFQPTVRNIVNVFTDAVEVFLSVIYDVSHEAETHPERDAQLKKAFNKNGNSDLKQVGVKFYPWPDYRANDAQNGYVEKYLGSPGVLENWRLVDELLFIEDLYGAFLRAKKISDEALLEQQKGNVWVPTNPFDTKIYNNEAPYERLPSNANDSDVIEYILIRMMTFMGYTHNESLIDTTNVKTMAEAEVKSLLSSKTIAEATKNALKNQFKDVDKLIADYSKDEKKFLKESGDYYRYIYIFDDNYAKLLPISSSFKKNDWDTYNAIKLNDKSNNGDIFLTNYTNLSELVTIGDDKILKKQDGGRYIDIKPISKYDNLNLQSIQDSLGETSNIISYSDLAAKKGYSIFNGKYAMQEFKNMNYDTNNSNKSEMNYSPLSYIFYRYRNIDNNMNSYANLLTFGRKDKTTIFPYDFDNTNPKIPTSSTSYNLLKFDNAGNELHKLGVINNRYLLTFNDNPNISYPYIEQKVQVEYDKYVGMSLFGSKLYYIQESEFSKAFLFLNTLPFFGAPFENDDSIRDNRPEEFNGILNNLFSQTGGFIYAPRLWCAWVGSLLWRSGMVEGNTKTNSDWLIKNKDGSFKADPIKYPTDNDPNNPKLIYKPLGRYNYFKDNLINTTASATGGYSDDGYSFILMSLPSQVRESFYECFYEFVISEDTEYTSWTALKNGLEIFNKIDPKTNKLNYDKFKYDVNSIYNYSYTINFGNTELPEDQKLNNQYMDKTLFNSFINTNNYSIISPVYDLANARNNGTFFNDALYLELKTDTEIQKTLVNALREEVVIVNSGFALFDEKITNDTNVFPLVSGSYLLDIRGKKTMIKTYLDVMQSQINAYESSNNPDTKKNRQDVFGTDNAEIVKLQLYRTCKNIYDKWVGYAPNGENVIFQCGGATRHTTDKAMAKKRESDTPKLIDSFRFVTRSFRDIGDDFFVDPRPIGTYLTDNPNSSFYDAITNLLAANNFDFIALPSFINYNDTKTLESIFDTYTYEEAIKEGICGPSFVCVYVGQKSKHLDFEGSEYDNDGFDVQCLPGGGMKPILPKDFTNTSKDYENDVAVFKVAYSQQNQNIFKDIILDQSEFTETEESLKIIDDISKTGSENQRHFGGQNLYSVYGVRSYKTEVEMMGNAMIQPMMYFQLDNIPMFHGAYLITHVKHSIKPNFMSTNFTGVRVRSPETPILDAAELYMSLLENIEITATNTTPSASKVKTIEELIPLISLDKFNLNKDILYVNY